MNQTAALPMMPTPPALPAETPLQKAARESVGHGLHLIAVEIGGKGPLAKGWTSTRHASAAAAVDALASHRGNFGVTMSSDIVVIDVDCKNGVDGAGSLQAYVQSLDSELPATRRTDTPSGGHHLYFRLPPGVTLRNGTKFLPGVDIRTAGGQVLCEPSVVNGKPYVAVRDAAGDQLPIADMPFVLAIAFAGTQHHGAPAAPRPPQVSPIEIDSALLGDLRAALAFHDPDNHDGWVTVGMALKSLGEPGYALWEEWSATSSRYPGGDGLDRWNSFRPDHTGPASVFKKAQAAGWKNPGRKRAKSIASAFAGQVATPGTVAANAAVLGPMPMPPAPPVPAVPVADAFPLDPVLSEDALALMFVSLCGAQFRHTPGMGWMRNDGPNWTRDDELRRLSQVRKLLRQVGASTGNDRVRLRVESAKTAAAVISFAASDERIAVPAAAWDANPAVLNTPAGIVDLRTGQIRPHAGELHTQVTRVSPDSTGPRGAFDGFMRAVFMGDAAMVEFMQRLLGYFATGDRREQKLFFAYGLGANGKSTLFDLVLWLLGTYGLKLPSNVLMQSGMERHPTELAQLQGRRLALSSELDAGQFWAESRIKELTGDETLRGRFMRQDYFEFPMTQKHLIVGNYKPRLRGGDQALGRRFVLVPFDAKFTEAQRDVLMAEKLRAEAPAVLAWVIEGAAKWYDSGLQIPARVMDASAEYLAEHDDIASWLDECCDVGPGHRARARDLYASFSIWIRARGQAAPSQTFWGGQLNNAAGITKRQSNGPIYEGVRVRSVVEFGQVGGVGGVTSLSTPHAHTYGVHIGGTPPTPPTA